METYTNEELRTALQGLESADLCRFLKLVGCHTLRMERSKLDGPALLTVPVHDSTEASSVFPSLVPGVETYCLMRHHSVCWFCQIVASSRSELSSGSCTYCRRGEARASGASVGHSVPASASGLRRDHCRLGVFQLSLVQL